MRAGIGMHPEFAVRMIEQLQKLTARDADALACFGVL